MENTAWHILAPNWSPWDYIYPHVIKLVLMVFSCSMFFSFGTWVWKWQEQSEFIIFQTRCTRKAKTIWSALMVLSFQNIEMALQLCQIWFCALNRPRQAFQVTKCWLWQPNGVWFAFKELRWCLLHTTQLGPAKGWRLKPRNGDFSV